MPFELPKPHYNILINEEQRAIISQCLTFARITPNLQGSYEELDILIHLFHDLPEDEKRDPGILHGFCL